MRDIVIDDTKKVLEEAGIKPECPKCGSRKMLVSYSQDFIVFLGEDEPSYEPLNSNTAPFCITCFDCAETIWEE